MIRASGISCESSSSGHGTFFVAAVHVWSRWPVRPCTKIMLRNYSQSCTDSCSTYGYKVILDNLPFGIRENFGSNRFVHGQLFAFSGGVSIVFGAALQLRFRCRTSWSSQFALESIENGHWGVECSRSR